MWAAPSGGNTGKRPWKQPKAQQLPRNTAELPHQIEMTDRTEQARKPHSFQVFASVPPAPVLNSCPSFPPWWTLFYKWKRTLSFPKSVFLIVLSQQCEELQTTKPCCE